MGKWRLKECEYLAEKYKSVEEQNQDTTESLTIGAKPVLFPGLTMFQRKPLGHMSVSGYNENMLKIQSTNPFTPCN